MPRFLGASCGTPVCPLGTAGWGMSKRDPFLWAGGETCLGFMWSLGDVLRPVLSLPLLCSMSHVGVGMGIGVATLGVCLDGGMGCHM